MPLDPAAGRPSRRRSTLSAAAAIAAVAATVLSACTAGRDTTGPAVTHTVTSGPSHAPASAGPTSPTSSSTTPPTAPSTTPSTAPSTTPSAGTSAAAPVSLRFSPAGASTGVDPSAPVTVSASGGTLHSVTMTNTASHVVVSGALDAGKVGWTSTEDLGYGNTYLVRAVAANAAGRTVTQSATVHTVAPAAETAASLVDIYGSALQDHGTYGIGMIPVVSFSAPVTDRAAAERALHVTTSPHVDGSWYWQNSSLVLWRPQNFYRPGTRVTVHADVYGVNLGGGAWGQSDESTSFTIGAKHVSIADDRTHTVYVYWNGTLKRSMPTSMGKHYGVYSGGKYISFFTMNGFYTVLGYENPARMCSASYGLDPNGPGGYPCENIPWATKISTDGIYLHELDSTVQYQGNTDTSHGCLNLDQVNAQWFYQHSQIGDVVKVVNTPGAPTIQQYQGGDWSVPWAQWRKGSALAA